MQSKGLLVGKGGLKKDREIYIEKEGGDGPGIGRGEDGQAGNVSYIITIEY